MRCEHPSSTSSPRKHEKIEAFGLTDSQSDEDRFGALGCKNDGEVTDRKVASSRSLIRSASQF